ncbi:hypothetical protein O6H91_07G091500 [Diphasiastrum complanatum]|uniref:Uncharacterized protein n=1 Tax=Diphasiastrum complanatum TaxID=34168 RepID=A0ACC2D7J7_DIPCM|nr:hypothetical protein O6H91_07G091500 [Diphasiastrum complanatum]
MLIQHLPMLSTKRIVLASASPRRAYILKSVGLQAEVISSTFDENLDKTMFVNPGDYAAETATHKAIEVSRRAIQAEDGSRADLIIGADTVVELDGKILEKPSDEEEAFRMLSTLRGRQHKVFTGVSLVFPFAAEPKIGQLPLVHSFWEETKVEFASFDDAVIRAYVATGEPMDKAGAYGIQGIGGTLVKSITGCFFNVMGFPIHRFSVELDNLVRLGALSH